MDSSIISPNTYTHTHPKAAHTKSMDLTFGVFLFQTLFTYIKFWPVIFNFIFNDYLMSEWGKRERVFEMRRNEKENKMRYIHIKKKQTGKMMRLLLLMVSWYAFSSHFPFALLFSFGRTPIQMCIKLSVYNQNDVRTE